MSNLSYHDTSAQEISERCGGLDGSDLFEILEFLRTNGYIAVRESKDPHNPQQYYRRFTREEQEDSKRSVQGYNQTIIDNQF